MSLSLPWLPPTVTLPPPVLPLIPHHSLRISVQRNVIAGIHSTNFDMEVLFGLVGMEGGFHVNREHEKPLTLLSPLMNFFMCAFSPHFIQYKKTVDESYYVPVRIAETYFTK